jgi:hypothetical protein
MPAVFPQGPDYRPSTPATSPFELGAALLNQLGPFGIATGIRPMEVA